MELAAAVLLDPETGMDTGSAGKVSPSAWAAAAKQASLSVRRLMLVGSSLHAGPRW